YRAAMALLDSLPSEARPRRELTLQIGLARAFASVEGWAAPATGTAYRRARELCLELGEQERLYSVLYGLWAHDRDAGRYAPAIRTAGELIELSEQHGKIAALLAGHSALAATLTFMGSWAEAHRHAERCIALYDPVRHSTLGFEYAEDPHVQ